jgi:DNA-binding CsgD family transcriptional regulator
MVRNVKLGDWSDPELALTAAHAVLQAPLGQTLECLSQVVAELVPHRALAMLTGDCARSPLRTAGDPALTAKITSGELARLAGVVDVGVPRCAPAVLAGESWPVLAVAAAPPGSTGAVLGIILTGEAAPVAQRLVQRLWDVIALHLWGVAAQASPLPLAENRAVASERARVVAEFTDAHSAALTGVLGALRSRALDDVVARRTATDIAVSALIELRAAAERDRDLSEETAGEAFARLADRLSPLTRYSHVQLELVAPEAGQRPLPAGISTAARAIVRGTVLVMLEQDGTTRIRVAWEVADAELRVTVRDDGPGDLAPDALAVHRLSDRVAALNGSLSLTATPGWGTTVTAALPLAAPGLRVTTDPLAALNPRELEVLDELRHGLRNRQIAERLNISEHTVKFHVANILGKLDVGTRGEAAAIAHSGGIS